MVSVEGAVRKAAVKLWVLVKIVLHITKSDRHIYANVLKFHSMPLICISRSISTPYTPAAMLVSQKK